MTQRRTTSRAVLYLRQSREREESTSIEEQERLCRRLCDEKGYRVVEVLTDRDTSGYEIPWRKRRNFPRVFDTDADVLVIYRWSRLSRDDFDQREILKKWGALGRKAEAQAEPVDTETASGMLHRGMLLEFAAHESRLRSEQWKETLMRRHSQGLPKNGLLRYGYTSPGRGLPLVPDPETAPILRELYLRYAAGAGFQALVQDLNERGITTRKGREWGTHSLIRMLDSGFGAGLLINGRSPNETYSPGVHEPVIKPEEWQAYRDARAARRQLPTKRRSPKWALSGIARCGLCSSPLNVSTYNEPKSQVRCTSYVNSRTCTGVWMNRRALENLIEMWLVAWQADPLRAVLSAERTEQADRARTQAHAVEEALTAAQTALGNLAVRFSQDLIDTEAHALAQVTLVQDRDRLAEELREARQEVARLGPVTDPLENPGDLTPGEWGHAVGRVLRRVEVTKDLVRMVPVVGEPMEFDR